MLSVLVLLALTGAPPQIDCKPQFAPLYTGSSASDSKLEYWTKEQAGDWGGGGWLGWDYDSNALVPVRLIVGKPVKLVPEEQYDLVSVESVPRVTFAVRCVRGVHAGAIRDANVMNHDLQYQGPLSVSLGPRKYRLRLQIPGGNIAFANVILSDGRHSQVLYIAGGFVDDPTFRIIWAGDLDRDGKLDLIVNLTRKYSIHPHRLLLSSRASRHQIVGEVAVFTTLD